MLCRACAIPHHGAQPGTLVKRDRQVGEATRPAGGAARLLDAFDAALGHASLRQLAPRRLGAALEGDRAEAGEGRDGRNASAVMVAHGAVCRRDPLCPRPRVGGNRGLIPAPCHEHQHHRDRPQSRCPHLIPSRRRESIALTVPAACQARCLHCALAHPSVNDYRHALSIAA